MERRKYLVTKNSKEFTSYFLKSNLEYDFNEWYNQLFDWCLEDPEPEEIEVFDTLPDAKKFIAAHKDYDELTIDYFSNHSIRYIDVTMIMIEEITVDDEEDPEDFEYTGNYHSYVNIQHVNDELQALKNWLY